MTIKYVNLNRGVFAPAIVLSALSRTLAQVHTSPDDRIRIEIAELRSSKGLVRCSLFSSAQDFPSRPDKGVALANGEISNEHAVCEFKGLLPGTYAVSVFHDENSNGKLDTNFVGIPREGVGASNDAKGHFGPPKFDAAAFQFSGGRLDLKIKINYF